MKGMSSNALESWALNKVQIIRGQHALDITALVQTVVVEEDIEKGFVTGSVAFIDSMNLMETMEMLGEEYLYLSFNSFHTDLTEKEPYSKLFRISSYTELTEPNLGTKRGVELCFCTPAEIYNELCNIRKSYSNASSSQIVKEMLEILQVDDTVNIEETLFMKDMIMPGITPLEVIAFMGRYSMSKATGDSNFYFFENRDGIHFVSGTTLVKQEPFEYVVEGTNPTDLNMYRKISNYQKAKGYDVLEQYRSGAIGLNIIMRDGLRKGYQEEALHYDKVKEQFPMLNNTNAVPYAENVQNAKQSFISTEQMYQYNNKSSYGNMYGIRNINRAAMSTKRSFVEAPGDSDVTAGMLLDLKVLNQIGQSSVRDSGKWLVAKVRHIINVNAGRYLQEMDLISDSNIIREINNVPGV